MKRTVWISIAVAGLIALVSPGVAASDLTYTFVDFGALGVASDLSGTRSPAAGQTVTVESGEGDGLTVGGSLALGQRFYLGAAYESSIVEVDASIRSPLATVSTSGNFDLVTTRAALGYVVRAGEALDIYFEARDLGPQLAAQALLVRSGVHLVAHPPQVALDLLPALGVTVDE